MSDNEDAVLNSDNENEVIDEINGEDKTENEKKRKRTDSSGDEPPAKVPAEVPECFKCPEPTKELPRKVWTSARYGRMWEVQAWLAEGGDVNAATSYGLTLLNAAASCGRTAVVKDLMNYPNLHINTVEDGKTALHNAIEYGHDSIVKLLLNSNLKCHLDLTISVQTPPGVYRTAIMIAADKKYWGLVEDILKIHDKICREEVAYLLPRAQDAQKWSVVQQLLQKDFVLTSKEYVPILREAYKLNRWEVVYAILHKDFRYKNESLNDLLFDMIDQRNWRRVEDLLGMFSEETNYNVNLVDTALEGQTSKFEQMLKKGKFDAPTLNGTLILIAAGGSNEQISRALLTRDIFSDDTLHNALFLAAKKNNLELIPHLLTQFFNRISYHSLSCARVECNKSSFRDAERLFVKALDTKIQTIFQKI
ncbi:ankyrin-2-like [Palaemon carinicauda]|uniref:ankyrin-2-like n=1 Tax=Palaemon carinicauda TaxID=392227 RepID=UPI0035B642A3